MAAKTRNTATGNKGRVVAPAPKDTLATASSTADEDALSPEGRGNDTVIVCLNRAQGIRFSLKSGQTVEVAGNAVHLRGREMGVLPVGGAFGMTAIPRKAWEEIQATFGDTALFKSGRIFAQDSRASAMAQARDHSETRHGLEPVACRHTQEGSAAEA